MAVVGIDLGTTYSVVATPQRFEGKYFEALGGVTIVKDDYSLRLTPSVVAVNRQGELLVGRRAKNQAGQQPAPIMFVKRTMGEDRLFALGDRQLRPEEVSAEILRYLKVMVEKQIGEPVEEAVITVPAYFTTIQKQKTKEAGELAGLRVGEILQEPVAAALMYCHDDDRDPLTIMTYDLGGGTFDVAILKKQEGVFEIKAFDGDRHLGGYDFDLKLTLWILDQLKAKGYQLDITSESPQWSKLLIVAETLKHKLSDHEVWEVQEANTGLLDANGEPVTIELEISREAFEGLIKDQIDETIRLCRRALEQAGLAPDALDEIVMVGGSSRIPLVAQRLEAAFGRRPRLVAPDLCVAVGAALMARRLGRRIGALKLGHIPETTSLSSIQIAGTIEPAEELSDVAGCTVVLQPADGSATQRQQTSQQGGFLFPQVPLSAGTTNGFVLRVEDRGGREILTHRFAVRRDAGVAAAPSLAGLEGNVLAKPIAIKTVDGLHVVATERTPLPCERHVPAQTEDQTGVVRIPVYEDTYPIGEIVVDGLPPDLPIGSRVEITLTLRSDFFIEGSASIPAAQREGRATIQMPPIAVRGLTELQTEYLALERRATEALEQADRGQAFKIAPRLRAALAASKQLLYEEREPTLAKVQDLLAEIEVLIRRLGGWRPNPPVAQFEQAKCEIADELLPALEELKPAGDQGYADRLKVYEGRLKAIGQRGEQALAGKNEAVWIDANRQLDELHDEIGAAIEQEERRHQRRTVGGAPPKEEQPDPRAIKLKLGLDLSEFRAEAGRRNRLPELEADLAACEQALKAIEPSGARAMDQLVNYYQNLHQPLQAKVLGRAPRVSTGDKPEWWGGVRVLPDQGKGQ